MLRSINNILVAARVKRGWSRTALAKEVDMSPSALSRLERGHGISERNAVRIAEALNRDVFEIFEIVNFKETH